MFRRERGCKDGRKAASNWCLEGREGARNARAEAVGTCLEGSKEGREQGSILVYKRGRKGSSKDLGIEKASRKATKQGKDQEEQVQHSLTLAAHTIEPGSLRMYDNMYAGGVEGIESTRCCQQEAGQARIRDPFCMK